MAERVSNEAISEQVADLSQQVVELASAVQGNGERMDNLNLNGSASVLHALAGAAPALLMLAKVAPRLIEVAEKQADLDGFWRTLRRFLNPFRPIGGAFWLILAGLSVAYLANVLHLIK